MIKKTITYTDYNGVEKTEDFYFNLDKGELLKMEVSAEDGSFVDYLQRIVDELDGKALADTFESFIDAAFGIKSSDGGFYKSEEALKHFKAKAAYSDLSYELFTNPDYAGEFFNGITGVDVKTDTSGVTPSASDQARARSQANLQGHKAVAPRTIVQEKLPEPAPVETQWTPQELAEQNGLQSPDANPFVPRATQTEQKTPEEIAQFRNEHPEYFGDA